MRKKNHNFLLYFAFILTVVVTYFIIYNSIFFKLSDNKSEGLYTAFNQGEHTINIVGEIEYKKESYQYTGSFKEEFLNISLYESYNDTPNEQIKKVSSGILGFEYKGKPITIRIDYKDDYEKEKNSRNYNVQVSYNDIKKTIEKTVEIKNVNLNPLYKLDISDILVQSGIFK